MDERKRYKTRAYTDPKSQRTERDRLSTNSLFAIAAVIIIIGGIGGYAAYTMYFAEEDVDEGDVVEVGDKVTMEYIGYLSDPRIYGNQSRVFDSSLQNVGEKGSPRVRRGDLPKKATRPKPKLESDGPDIAGKLLLSKLGVS